MAIYRIFPEKDTFISSEPTVSGLYKNAGLDPVIELGGYPDLNGVGRSKRILTKFKEEDITSGLALAGTNYTASLIQYIAEAKELPTSITIEALPISSSWDRGVGQESDEPANQSGVTWTNRTKDLTWDTAGGDTLSEYTSSVVINDPNSLDLNINVSSYISAISSSTITDNGLLLKIEDTYENYTTQSINLSYYGNKSHTIFKPVLEFGWDDSSFSPGSLSEVSTDDIVLRVNNIKKTYINSNTPVKFKITSRPQYPTTTFVTSSIKTNYVLPQESYWSAVDVYTDEPIVNYSDNTKISADSNGSYFNVYMNSFAPNRYYKFKFKTTIDGSTLHYSDDKPFKVVRWYG